TALRRRWGKFWGRGESCLHPNGCIRLTRAGDHTLTGTSKDPPYRNEHGKKIPRNERIVVRRSGDLRAIVAGPCGALAARVRCAGLGRRLFVLAGSDPRVSRA